MRRRVWLPLAIFLALGLGFGAFERGNRQYRAGKYAEAVAAYKEALESGNDSPELRYNLGTALLALGKRQEAEPELRRALGSADPELRRRAYYNLGNRFLLEAREAKQGTDTGPLLDSAVEAYKEALRLQPKDLAAKWNLELALREQEKQESQGGGGSQEPQDPQQQQGQGGGGGGSPNPSQGPPSPAERAPGSARNAPLSQEQADRVLSAAEQDERELYREKLRKGPSSTPPTVRDW